MTQVAVKILPMFLELIQDVIGMHQNNQLLEGILSQTRELQRASAGLADNGPGLGDGEGVAALHEQQQKSHAAALVLFEKNRCELAELLEQYLAEHRIVKGMMLIDDWDGKPFEFKALHVRGDLFEEPSSWVSSDGTLNEDAAETVELWLGEKANDLRIGFSLLKGTTITAVK